MTETILNHKTAHEVPQAIRNFLNQIFLEHMKHHPKDQVFKDVHISVSLDRKKIRIESISSDFVYDPKKGLEQFA